MSKSRKRVTILGVPLDNLTIEEALERLTAMIESGQPHQIVTVNPEFILEAEQNPEFAQVLTKADLSLADGVGVTWAARFLDQPLLERIPGADLVNLMAQTADQKGWRLYLLGAGQAIAKTAAEHLKKAYPNLQIVGAEPGIVYNPAAPEQPGLEELIKRINKAQADILLVAFGAPKQDLFIARHKTELKVPVMIGVGGTLDYLAGRIERAPKQWRQLGLEWLWRLVQEPSRFKRIWRAVAGFPIRIIVARVRSKD